MCPRVGVDERGGGCVAGARGTLPSAPCPQVYVLKRPHVDEFLQRMGELFECVLFTASLAKVGAPSVTLPFPARHDSSRLLTHGHRCPLAPCLCAGSASARLCCLPACPSKVLARETEAQGKPAPVESCAPSSLVGWHGAPW